MSASKEFEFQPSELLDVPRHLQILAFGVLVDGSLSDPHNREQGGFIDLASLEAHFTDYCARQAEYSKQHKISPIDNPLDLPGYLLRTANCTLGVVFDPESERINVQHYLEFNPEGRPYLEYLQNLLATIDTV